MDSVGQLVGKSKTKVVVMYVEAPGGRIHIYGYRHPAPSVYGRYSVDIDTETQCEAVRAFMEEHSRVNC